MHNHIPPSFGELKNEEKKKKGVLRIQCKKEGTKKSFIISISLNKKLYLKQK